MAEQAVLGVECGRAGPEQGERTKKPSQGGGSRKYTRPALRGCSAASPLSDCNETTIPVWNTSSGRKVGAELFSGFAMMPAMEAVRDLARPSVAGYILTGGHSSRFGRNKALYLLRGQPMVLHVANALDALVRPVTLVGTPEAYRALALPAIPDRVAGAGPLGGIVSALEHSRSRWALIVACDMPRLASAPLAKLLDRALHSTAQAIVPRTPDGRLQPLCAIYSKTALGALSDALQGRTYKLMDAFAGLRWDVLTVDDAAPFANVNRLSDLGLLD